MLLRTMYYGSLLGYSIYNFLRVADITHVRLWGVLVGASIIILPLLLTYYFFKESE